ncbi:MAG: hypothetical protein AAGI15_05210, partial [Pseudomonadota bacterium]
GLPGNLVIAPDVGTDLGKEKKNAQSRANNAMIRKMKAAGSDDAKLKQAAEELATSPCLADQMVDDWKAGKQTPMAMDVQADHPIETKLGGPANMDDLKALDSNVNGFFGNSVAKIQGNRMLDQQQDEVSEVTFLCTPPCSPPHSGAENNDYSTSGATPLPASHPNPVTVSSRS